MSTPPDLHNVDALQPVDLDPAIWNQNLAALRESQPAVAARLERVTLPSTWRPARALDGAITYRLEGPGEPPAWLDGTAIPTRRAAALFQELTFDGRNPALPSAGAWAELHWLLEHLPATIAVFVFEEQPALLAATLRLKLLAPDIAAGRCLFFVAPDEAAELERVLGEQVGLLPPGQLLLPLHVTEARLEVLRTVCERVHSDVVRTRTQRLAALAAEPRGAPTGRRAALLALQPNSATHTALHDLSAAAARRGWHTCVRTLRHPNDVHALAHAEALATFTPGLTVCVDHLPGVLPAALCGDTYVWFTRVAHVPASLPPGLRYLAATPRIAAAVARAGGPAERTQRWPWAQPLETPMAPAPAPPRDAPLLVVGDFPVLTPTAHGLQQASQQRLWDELLVLARRDIWTRDGTLPEALLTCAARRAEAKVSDAALRAQLLQLIRDVIVPAVLLEQSMVIASQVSQPVATLGCGWERLVSAGATWLGPYLDALPERGTALRPALCLFASGFEGWAPILLHAAAHGWPLAAPRAVTAALEDELGDLLVPHEHILTFADAAGLTKLIEFTRRGAGDGQRVAAAAQRHVLADHTYGRRWQQLTAWYVGSTGPL